MTYKIRETVEREVSAEEYRQHLNVRPSGPPCFQIGDIVRCEQGIDRFEAGVVEEISWSNKFDDAHYSYRVSSLGPEPGKRSTRHCHEGALHLLTRITFDHQGPDSQP